MPKCNEMLRGMPRARMVIKVKPSTGKTGQHFSESQKRYASLKKVYQARIVVQRVSHNKSINPAALTKRI